jgi:hypothetical protein
MKVSRRHEENICISCTEGKLSMNFKVLVKGKKVKHWGKTFL